MRKNQEESETKKGEDRKLERFGEVTPHSEKHLQEGKVQRQVYVEAHQEEVQDCELRGHGKFEWNTDLIETQKLENYTAKHRTCTMERHNTSLEELTKNNTADLFTKHRNELRTQSLARKLGLRILEGTNGDD